VDISLHVEAGNYGVVEDSHQALMHGLAQCAILGMVADDAIPGLTI
jgi:hypothetical protein